LIIDYTPPPFWRLFTQRIRIVPTTFDNIPRRIHMDDRLSPRSQRLFSSILYRALISVMQRDNYNGNLHHIRFQFLVRLYRPRLLQPFYRITSFCDSLRFVPFDILHGIFNIDGIESLFHGLTAFINHARKQMTIAHRQQLAPLHQDHFCTSTTQTFRLHRGTTQYIETTSDRHLTQQ
jgi:hypothetical protein